MVKIRSIHTESTPEPKATFTKGTSAIVDMDTYSVESPYQTGTNHVHVLLPGLLEAHRNYRVLYVLPVGGDALGPDEAKLTWGTGVHAILGNFKSTKFTAIYENQARKYHLICVFPDFATCPWFGDNLVDPKKRHESYLLQVVLPFIERTYPTITVPQGRFLIGFSKSGFGALGLHVRHPDIFGGSLSWDAPLMEKWPGRFGINEHFGSEDAFSGWYMPTVLEKQASLLKQDHIIVLAGYDLFQKPMDEAHALLSRVGIPHQYLNGPSRPHHWYSGWVPKALAALMSTAGNETGAKP